MTHLKEAVTQLSSFRKTILSQKDQVFSLQESIRKNEEQEKELFESTLQDFIVELNREIAEEGFILPGKQLIQLEGSMAQLIRNAPCMSIVGIAHYRLLELSGDLTYDEKLQFLMDNEEKIRKEAFEWSKRFQEYQQKCEKLFHTLKELFVKEVVQGNLVSDPSELKLNFYPSTHPTSFAENISLHYKNRSVHLIELLTYKQYLDADLPLDKYMERLRRSIKRHIAQYGD